MKKLLFVFFLASCSAPQSSTDTIKSPLVFNNDLSFDDFNELLIEYAKITPHPNIDE